MLNGLLQIRKYECQQCQYEHTKGHQVLKIKWFLVHQHHLPFYVRIEVIHPATRLLRNSFYHNTLCVFKFFFMAIPHSNASAIYFSAPIATASSKPTTQAGAPTLDWKKAISVFL